MQGGDISNEIFPRILIEFEDLIAHKPEEEPRKWRLGTRARRLRDEVYAWEINDLVVKVMWRMVFHFRHEIDVITLQGEEFAELLAERLDEEQVPANRVWATEPRKLARRLAAMPYVAAIYTGSPERAAIYGQRGRLVTADNVTLMGQF